MCLRRKSVKSIAIGIHLYSDPMRLQATLDSLRANTPQPFELLLLPDGPALDMQRLLSSLSDIPQLTSARPLGASASFNRFVSHSQAEILVFLESGSLVGPGWLDHLLVALDADSRNGLAGPSTNHCWNEQGVFHQAGGSAAEIGRTAQLADQRFGTQWRLLEPLHSLADFCYVVRRDVVDAIGAADEAYGLGPCWEMDYNVRAARAGFRGIWACAAYVYRSPLAERRRDEEARRFTASKHRYQDKFCALKLRGEQIGYEAHCRGDACEHFAPSELIQIALPLPHASAVTPEGGGNGQLRSERRAPAYAQETTPLVSCIMPTGNRSRFVRQSVHYLQRQDYPNWELIIVDDGQDDLARQLPDDPRIHHVAVPRGLSIGTKRNRACELARGELIAQWDDDDWYGPTRLSTQIAPLLPGQVEITALEAGIFFDLDRWQFWRCSPELHQRLFVGDVIGGTLVFHRRVWQDLTRYPDTSLAEDAGFLHRARQRGARLLKLANIDLFMYLRHGRNTWRFTLGSFLDARGWRQMEEPACLAGDRAFYASLSPAAPDHGVHERVTPTNGLAASLSGYQSSGLPLVSCIMPTANRRHFVPQALRYFQRQDYERLELIVLDDGDDAVADLIPDDPRIHYHRLESKRSIGAKRNLACQHAKGSIIVHWDDDDWMAPWRVSYQVGALLDAKADINGLDRIHFFDPASRLAWQYVFPEEDRRWVGGTTLCYRKSFWQANPFPDINVGEDTKFVWSNRDAVISPLDNSCWLVALIHAQNISPKRPAGRRWQSLPVDQVLTLMGEDADFYSQQRWEHGAVV